MGILSWIVIGLIAGWLAKLVVPGREPGGFLATTAIGVVGAIIGGWIWSLMGQGNVTAVNGPSILVAFVGSVVLLVLYHAVSGGRTRA